MNLQKKYYPFFKLGHENIYVLPPILKRSGLSLSLAFPVAHRFDKSTISRPVGVILISRNLKEKYFDLSEFEFTEYSYDFEKKYTYKTYEQEFLKVTLNLLKSCYPKFPFMTSKSYAKKYLPRLKNSFDEEYWAFYEDLISNKILKISDDIALKRENVKNNIINQKKTISKNKNKIENEVNFELKNYIRNEVWKTLINQNAFLKVAFLDNLGESLRKHYEFSDRTSLLNQKKFEMAKAYAKAQSKLKTDDENVDFLCKLLIIFLNAMLVEEKKKKVIKFFEIQIKDSCTHFDENINKLDDKEIKDYISSIYSSLIKDYSVTNKKDFSNIFFAYMFLFLN
ncbi:MAG: hypothetical protein EOM55_04070 [Clostridia bacterium]|nr:hypothetical protein [Clostridia bacterium]